MEELPESFQLILATGDGLGRIVVDLSDFFEFSWEISRDLQLLTHRWPNMRESEVR